MASGELNAQQVANVLKVSRRTLFSGLKAAREHDSFWEPKQTGPAD